MSENLTRGVSREGRVWGRGVSGGAHQATSQQPHLRFTGGIFFAVFYAFDLGRVSASANTGSPEQPPGTPTRVAWWSPCTQRSVPGPVLSSKRKRPALRTAPKELGAAHKTEAALTGTPGCHGNRREEWVLTGVGGLPCLVPGFGVLFSKGSFRRRHARAASGRAVLSARREMQGHHAPPPAAARGARGGFPGSAETRIHSSGRHRLALAICARRRTGTWGAEPIRCCLERDGCPAGDWGAKEGAVWPGVWGEWPALRGGAASS